MEVKLSPSEYRNWYLARRDRDRDSARGHRKTAEPKREGDKTQGKEKEKNKPQAKEADKPASPPPADQKSKDKDKPQLKLHHHEEPVPFVDKVLDKALEVMKAKLAEESKAKAA